jgi:hypothetical protein
MNDYNATRAELLEALAAQAARLARIETDRDVWRNESIKKQAACEQMGARIGTLEAERDRLREALRDCVETWRPLLADADLTAHENPAYLTLMRADLVLGEDRRT